MRDRGEGRRIRKEEVRLLGGAREPLVREPCDLAPPA